MCYKSSWPCVLAPAITGLTVPFFCSVPWSFLLCLRLVCSEQAGCSLVSLQLFPCSAPLQWPRSLAALFKQGNTFLQFLWQEWALPQGSKPLFLSFCSSLVQCVSSATSGEAGSQASTPKNSVLLLPKDNGKTSSWARTIHRAHTINAFGFMGLSYQHSHPLLADTWQNPPTHGKSWASL